jgi:hypothetical protein
MFTWICPQCGREVPPAYDACPDCAAKAKSQPPEQSAVQPPPGPQVATVAPPPPPAYAAQAVAPPAVVAPPLAQYAVPPPRAALPTWLLAILFAFAFVGLGAGVYWALNYFHGGTQAASPVEAVPVKGPAKANPLQKYVEVSGIRFVETPQHQTEARFVVVNHSGADITDLAGTVNVWGRTVKSEEEAAGTFNFKLASLKPYESKEEAAPLSTKLKPYELPDWQNLSAEVQITAP